MFFVSSDQATFDCRVPALAVSVMVEASKMEVAGKGFVIICVFWDDEWLSDCPYNELLTYVS